MPPSRFRGVRQKTSRPEYGYTGRSQIKFALGSLH